jgi:hypothetical protein
MPVKEDDPFQALLKEWEAPQPSAALDARVREAYRAGRRSSPWRRFWSARISVPVPALAALLLILAAVWFQFRPRPSLAQPSPVIPPDGAYLTRLETAGFQPIPDGASRVVRAGELKQ